jgi:hypothetical protein
MYGVKRVLLLLGRSIWIAKFRMAGAAVFLALGWWSLREVIDPMHYAEARRIYWGTLAPVLGCVPHASALFLKKVEE